MENSEWVEAVIKRFSSALPHRPQNQLWTPNDQVILDQASRCVVELSGRGFAAVISSLCSLLQELNKTCPPSTAQEDEIRAYCIVLDSVEQCLAKHSDMVLDDADIHALQQLYQRITHLCLLHGDSMETLASAANKVLYQFSRLHFHGIFNKIILRMTSMNRVTQFNTSASSIPELPSASTSTCSQICVIGLIPHLNLNASRLQQILQAIVTSFKDLQKRNRQLFQTIPPMLHKSIWNFIQEYPFEFNEVLRRSYPSLERSAEKLFNLCDDYADSTRKKVHIWPLQNAALILCPNVLKDITESVDKTSPTHKTQRGFITSLQKALSTGKRDKEMTEAALICAIDLFKAGSFVEDRTIAFFRYFVTLMQGHLHSLLFSQSAPFLHNSCSLQAVIPTFTDRDLMTNCLVAQFRCNHMNSHIFTVCLEQGSPTVFRVAFVDAMYIVIKEKSMSWWPSNKAVYTYAPQLRHIFQNTVPLLRRYDLSNPSLVAEVKAYLSSPAMASSMLQAKSKSDRKTLVEMVTNYQLVRGLIKLFSLDPMLAFSQLREYDRVGECLVFMTSLVGLVQHQAMPFLPLRVSDVLLLLHLPENIELWDPKDSMNAFWDISGQVTYSLAMKLFSRKTMNPIQLLEWLKKILHYRTLFLKEHANEASQGSSCKILQQMYTMLETVLLLFLRNTNMDAVRVAESCFKYLVLEAELVEPSVVPYSPNIKHYHQLESLSNMRQIGRAAQQKKIRGILKGLVHTPGSALAWEDTYSSWRVTKALLMSYQRTTRDEHPIDFSRFATESFPRGFMRKNTPTQSSSNMAKEQQLNEDNLQGEMLNWTNMTGFLCSLAGVSTKSSPSSYSLLLMSGGANGEIPNLIDGDGGGKAGDSSASFSLGTCTLGGSGGSGDIMGPPTSPVRDPNHIRVKRSSSYHGGRPKSMTQINPPSRSGTGHHNSIHAPQPRVSSSSESMDTDDKPRTSQTESFVNELMQLLKCDNEAVGVQLRETVKELVSYELSPPVYSYLFQCMTDESSKVLNSGGRAVLNESNTAMVDQLVSIVQHVVDNNAEGAEGALQSLVHVNMDETVLNFIMYVNDMDLSERSVAIKIKICHLVETLMQHHLLLNFKSQVHFRNQVADCLARWMRGVVFISENVSHIESLQNDLDLNALRAMGQVLSGLVLQSKMKSSDMFEEKGKLFMKYFKSFMTLIHSLNKVQWSEMSPIHKQPLLRHCASLREYTIQAMSNMLTANIDSGLIHAIGLGYHDDLNTRISFIEVLTSILKQGAEFNSLADTALADSMNAMIELVVTEANGDVPVMMALVNAVSPENLDELADVLVTLFDSRNRLAPFLTRILNTEVEALESGRVDTLFRGNSIACKVLSVSFKTFGLYYLQSVLRPLIIQLIKTSELDYEVDPSRLSDLSRLKTNQANLMGLVHTFYQAIQKSLPSLPLQLRTLCHILYSVVVTHFPNSAVDTVNSAIFLRFINPAIVSPHSYGLVQGEIPSNVRRGLTFLSKVLQNLANHVLFKKEAHMEVFNDFLCSNFEVSRELALNMARMGPYVEGEAGEFISFLKETHKHRLHSLLWTNHDKVASYAASIRTCVTSRHIFQELNTLLARLGSPNYRRARTLGSTTSSTSGSTSTGGRGTMLSSQLEEFLDDMAVQCDEKMLRAIKTREVFYQAGRSKAGNDVYYYIARKFKGDQLHQSNHLLYHVMNLLKTNTRGKSFEIVVDLTQASTINEPDLEMLVKFAAYVPELHMSRIDSLYFYNANMAFKQSANKFENMSKVFSHIKGAKRIVMVDSYTRLSEYIDMTELRLPAETMAYEHGSKSEYKEVNILMFKHMAIPIPATLHVCECGLVASLTERLKVFDTLIMLREMYHISDIREVYCEDKTNLSVRLIEAGQVLKFTTPSAETIAKEISTCISKWQKQQPTRYMSERKLEPQDVPGTFLNLSLLNLGSSYSSLRTAAYKLLSAVKDTFKLSIAFHLESSHDLCIPINCTDFVLSVSQQLARNEPHLTLEFLSEVVARFQSYSPTLKQHCLAYLSPWLPNLSRFAIRGDTPLEQEKLMKLIDLLVALTVSEEDIYPLIQAYIWTKIGHESVLLKKVLYSFFKMGVAEGLGSRKVEVLADTAVTLEQGQDGFVASEVIKKLLSSIAHTADRTVNSLEKSKLWSQLTVLARFLLALSFNNKLNVCKNAADVFYSCVLLMAHGSKFVRATVHGILLNTMQSIASLPQVMADERVSKEVSLKLVEFSASKYYMQFGLSSSASLAAFLQTESQHQGMSTRHPSTHESSTKDSLSSSTVLCVVHQLLHVVHVCTPLIPDYNWLHRWQRLARRTSFYYNPALQTRSFLMLGVISEKTEKIYLLVSKTLKVLEETLQKHEADVELLEAIISCLTHFVPLLDQTCQDMNLHQHLFWVAVGVLQQGEATLYSAGLELMEACVKAINAGDKFRKQNLSEMMQATRDLLEWPLTQMDRQVGLSFSSHFHFALAGLLYRGFSHCLSTVRTRAQDLLTTLFFIHSPELNSTLTSAPIVVNQDNLAYLAALFPESELVREQLLKRRLRNKQQQQQQQPPTPINTDPSFNDAAFQSAVRNYRKFGTLLSMDVISTPKDQVLFLLVLSSALVQSPEDQKIELLYRFLSDASAVFTDVFPLIHCVLVEHMQKMLQISQNSSILNSINSLITTAVNRSSTPSENRTIKSSYINDIGFGGLSAFFKPFPKQHSVYPTPQGALFQKYIATLTTDVLAIDTPPLSSSEHPPLNGSLSKLSMASAGSTNSLKETGSQGGRIKTSPAPWSPGIPRIRYGASRSRETSPASVGNLSMDELDVED